MKVVLKKSSRKEKKYMVVIDDSKTVHFGATGYGDYTTHNDMKRKDSYIMRHQPREDWSKAGIKTAGFWARYLLWNKKTLKGSIRDTEKRFNINISY